MAKAKTPAPTPRQAARARARATGQPAGAERRPARLVTENARTGERYELNLDELGPGDDRLTRKVCGRAISSLLQGEPVGVDGIALIEWLSRNKAGEALAYNKVEAKYADLGMMAVLDEWTVYTEEVDDDAEEAAAVDPTGSSSSDSESS